jgi:hypothetical protein
MHNKVANVFMIVPFVSLPPFSKPPRNLSGLIVCILLRAASDSSRLLHVTDYPGKRQGTQRAKNAHDKYYVERVKSRLVSF